MFPTATARRVFAVVIETLKSASRDEKERSSMIREESITAAEIRSSLAYMYWSVLDVLAEYALATSLSVSSEFGRNNLCQKCVG